MAYFFHLLHRFLSDSYMVSLCPDLLEQHSQPVHPNLCCSPAHWEKKETTSLLSSRTGLPVIQHIQCSSFTKPSITRAASTSLTSTSRLLHAASTHLMWIFFPSIQCQDLKLRIVISAFSISMSLRTCTLSLLQDRVCYCAQAQMSPFHSLVSIPITSVFRTRLHIHHHQSYNMSLRCSLLFSQTRTSDTLEPVSKSSVKQQSSCKCGDVSSILS